MIAAGVFYSRQSAFWVRCSLFVCATYAHQKEVNFCVPLSVCACCSLSLSLFLTVWLAVCVCVLLCACVCLVSTDIKLLVCTTSQRTTASQQSARSQSSLVLPPSPTLTISAFHIYINVYIYKYISYIYLRVCVCVIPMQLEPKMGTVCHWSLSPSPLFLFRSFFFWYSCQGYGCFGTISCSLYIYNRYKNHKQWWQRVVKHTENWQWK